MNNLKHLFKVVVVGNPGVGKTSIVNRYTKGKFDDKTVSTIGVDFDFKRHTVNNTDLKLQVFDTTGDFKYRCIVEQYIQNAQVVVFVFSLIDRSSLRKVKKWINLVDSMNKMNVTRVLVGNKLDLATDDNRIKIDEIHEFLSTLRVPMVYLEVSAKDQTNIGYLFDFVGDQGLNHHTQVLVETLEEEEPGCCLIA